MKKTLLFVMSFALCAFIVGCGKNEAAKQVEAPKDTPVANIESVKGEEIKEVIINPQTGAPEVDNSKVIINSEFMTAALEDSMQLDSKDFDFYQLSSFSKLDKKAFKYYMVSNVQIYKDISSLLILAASEHENTCWLVNYDKNNRYLGALVVGYDEWADGSNGIDSVINTKGAPYYIELTNRSMNSKEIVKTEILPSGKFNEISRMNVGTGV